MDGEQGRLVIRGHDVEGLAGRVAFEDVCALLWDGRLPDGERREQVRTDLARGRRAAFERLPALRDALDAVDGMDALRIAAAHLTDPSDASITGALAVFAAA